MRDDPATFTFTRDQIADALTRLDVKVLTGGPAAGMIDAASMADAIVEALTDDPDPVHYRWPVKCGEPYLSGIRWTGNLDRVTCKACRSFPDEPAKEAGQ
jgi:hypothetical protein